MQVFDTKEKIIKEINNLENILKTRLVVKVPEIFGYGNQHWNEYKKTTSEFIRQRDELADKLNSFNN